MKIRVNIGTREGRLIFIKFINSILGEGLKVAKDFVDSNTKNYIILETESYEKARILFSECDLKKFGYSLTKYRVDVINDLLRENTAEYVIENEVDYPDFLKVFNYLYKNDKKNLKNKLKNLLLDFKNKKIEEHLYLDAIDELEKLKL